LTTNRPEIALRATVRADFSASFKLIVPQAGGVFIDLYLIAGIDAIFNLIGCLGQEII